jgi:hypothetical protein
MSDVGQDRRLALAALAVAARSRPPPAPIHPPEEVHVVHLMRRSARHAQRGARASIRIRPGGFGLLTGVAVVGAIGLAVGGGRIGAMVRTAPGVLGAGAAAALGPVPTSVAPASATAIPDVPWLVQRPDGSWVYGRGTRSMPRVLPAGEAGLAISEGWVATVVPGSATTSTIRFRTRASGRVVADVAAPIWVSAGAWSSAGLVVTGYGDRSMATDGGLVLVSPEARSTTTLVAGGPFDQKLGRPAARGDVAVSPSGRWVAGNACGIRLCDTQVVDVTTGQVSRPMRAAEGFLRVVTDDAIVTTDADATWISARRFADGAEAWHRRDSVLLDPVATADGSVVAVTGSHRTGWGVASIDAGGSIRDLGPRGAATRAWPRVWTALSGPATVVVASQPFAEWIGSGRGLAVTVVGLGGQRPTSAAVDLRLPAASEWSR